MMRLFDSSAAAVALLPCRGADELVNDEEEEDGGDDVESITDAVGGLIGEEGDEDDALSRMGRETKPPSRSTPTRNVVCSSAPSTQMFSNKTAGRLTAEMDALICERRSSMTRCWDAAMLTSVRINRRGS